MASPNKIKTKPKRRCPVCGTAKEMQFFDYEKWPEEWCLSCQKLRKD